ncbi:MAG: 50S ribosomal protein L10 [Proteobacteria bacterium]|nr:50S ribosomal protein L10 [Pseudomonadota bacterium]MBU1714031.1 50S ribosomal protein L10 [Pseudomonadota bacterium]
MNREDKAAIVDELSDKFANAKIAVATDYRGLTVPVFEQLRQELRKINAEIRVVKNTLLRRAVKGTDFESMDEYFKGTTALTVSCDDPVSPAKVIVEFASKNPQLAIKTASLAGKLLTQDDLIALSKLPGKEVLLGQLLSVMQAVPTGFVRVLNGVPQKMVYLLQAIHDQKSANN